MQLIRVFPLAWLTKYTVFTFPFPDSGSLIWILPSDYSSTDSKRSTVNIPKPMRSCSWTCKVNKLLVSPNERLNNIILERTIEYNTTQPQNSTAKESNATSEIVACVAGRRKGGKSKWVREGEALVSPLSFSFGRLPHRLLRSRHMERKTKVHMAYSRAHMFVTSYHMSQLRCQFTSRDHS